MAAAKTKKTAEAAAESTAETAAAQTVAQTEEKRYSKGAILRTSSLLRYRDFLNTTLQEGKTYTLSEVYALLGLKKGGSR